MRQNFREIAGVADRYSKFVREERNLAAIFYHFLQQENYINKFYEFIYIKPEINPKEFGIYFEYAYLRDVWHNLKNNDDKIKLINEFIPQDLIATAWKNKSVKEFNSFFVATQKASTKYIHSPGRWNISRLNVNIVNNDDFTSVCKFKWAFNIKPDIVIHTSLNSAVCIEAKLESGEGSYPQNRNEKEIFNKRGLDYIKQTDMQKFLMNELLGYDTTFVLLVKDDKRIPKRDDYMVKKWADLFDFLDVKNTLPFMEDMMDI